MKKYPFTLMGPDTVKLINKQITQENQAAAFYLDAAVWCDVQGWQGAAQFLYQHAEEEREHMLKFIRYLTELGVQPTLSATQQVGNDHTSLHALFTQVFENEKKVTRSIHALADYCLQCKDYRTFEFLQWFVREQREEEIITHRALELFDVIGQEGIGLYQIDQALGTLHSKTS